LTDPEEKLLADYIYGDLEICRKCNNWNPAHEECMFSYLWDDSFMCCEFVAREERSL